MVVDTDRHNLTVFYLKSFDMDSVQVGKAVFVKEITLPWESNPGPTPNRGDLATLVASVGLKNFTCGHSPLHPSKVGFPWLSTIR